MRDCAGHARPAGTPAPSENFVEVSGGSPSALARDDLSGDEPLDIADSIPQETKDRIFAAAREFNYRPSFVARSLRTQRSFTVGVMVPEVSEGYGTLLLSGIEDYLLQEGYFYFVSARA
jgi:hypothetical protein